MGDTGRPAHRFPSEGAGGRVQRKNIGPIPWQLPSDPLLIAAFLRRIGAPVPRHDQSPVLQDRRRPQPMATVKSKLLKRPDDLPGKVDSRDAPAAENGVHTLAIRAGRGRGIRVAALFASSLLPENFGVPLHHPSCRIQTQHPARPAIIRRRRDKNIVAPHNRRRMPLPRNRRLPFDPVRFRPPRRQHTRQRIPLAAGTTETRPMIRSHRGWNQSQSGHHGRDKKQYGGIHTATVIRNHFHATPSHPSGITRLPPPRPRPPARPAGKSAAGGTAP